MPRKSKRKPKVARRKPRAVQAPFGYHFSGFLPPWPRMMP